MAWNWLEASAYEYGDDIQIYTKQPTNQSSNQATKQPRNQSTNQASKQPSN